MSTLFSYFTSWWETPKEIPSAHSLSSALLHDNILRSNNITSEEILKIKLKPINKHINKHINKTNFALHASARNLPPQFDKTTIISLNKAQLSEMLKIKLKPISNLNKKNYYEPRHPVLKELLQIRKKTV